MRSFVVIIFFVFVCSTKSLRSEWSWECVETVCQKKQITDETSTPFLSIAECKMLCSETILWPIPTGNFYIGKNLSEVNLDKVALGDSVLELPGLLLFKKAFDIFLNQKANEYEDFNVSEAAVGINIFINLKNLTQIQLTLDTDESYSLQVQQSGTDINVTINATNFFGARHALETVGQLIIFDDLHDRWLIPNNVTIIDKPAYKWRGIGLDTARNYVDLFTIKRTLDGMAASKLNTFHWHLVDSQSFPYESKSRPEFSKLGAYSPRKIYSNTAVRDVIEYARVRGIRVVPELDAPSHVGEGWQNTGAVVCFNQQPWVNYCGEPPCGQINPLHGEVYDILADLYGDMLEQFGTDIFHMGGDEVNFSCWNSTKNITNYMINEKGWDLEDADFIRLWSYFQKQAYSKLIEKAGQSIPVILWSSELTASPSFADNFSNENYIIQMWTAANDQQIQTLLEHNFTLILSNYDALYLDCGYAGWVSGGNNWCSPYNGWQLVYENKPVSIAGSNTNLILGEEVLLWTEEARSTSIDGKIWPRAAALGEVLWSDPTGSWRDAEQRMLVHTERLAALGINTDALQPEWCLQNEMNCPA